MSNKLAVQDGGNIVGALLFFNYILAALFFSSYIVFKISQIKVKDRNSGGSGHVKSSQDNPTNAIHNIQQRHARQQFSAFCALAFASFAALSWNMLNFLITSFAGWASEHDVPTSLRLDDLTQIRQQAGVVWMWSLDSNLFQTFAEDLVIDQSGWKAVRVALVYSYVWNSWMSNFGHAVNVPALWAYFVLDQILPVSFTQNLFCAAFVCVISQLEQQSNSKPAGSIVYCLRAAGLSCYCAALYWIPSTVGTRWFFPTLFTLRLLLFAPYLVDRYARRSSASHHAHTPTKISTFNQWLLAISITYGLVTFSQPGTSISAARAFGEINYAAAALLTDLLIGVVSGLLLFSVIVEP